VSNVHLQPVHHLSLSLSVNQVIHYCRRDGREIIVDCPPIIFAEPPALNSIITVSYNSTTPDGRLKNAQYIKTKVTGNDIPEPENKDEKQILTKTQ